MHRTGRHMGPAELAVMVSLWTTIVWIGMDMYLPALPLLDEAFGCSEGLVNATLFTYQVFMAIGSLVGGPLSDRLGRRIPLLSGAALFLVSTTVCATAPNIGLLVAARIASGFGGGVVSAVVMAIVKDELDGELLDRVVTATQSLVIVGPIAAPFLGSLAIDFVGWRGIFWVLAALALACTLWVIPLAETLPQERRADVPVWRSLGLLFELMKNPSFTLLLAALSAPAFSFGAFMTLCSYIYIDGFGLSNAAYSICYAVTTAASIAGPFAYLWLKGRTSSRRIVRGLLIALVATGAAVLVVGPLAPVLFLLTCMPFAFAESMARPCAFLVLLRANPERAGSASALVSFITSGLCALGTPAASLPWSSHLAGMGWIVLLSGVVGLALLAILLRVLRSPILDDDSAVEA